MRIGLVAAVVVLFGLFPSASRSQGGYTWTAVTPAPTPNHLNGVCSITGSDVWAVGDGGTILHYNGTGWSTAESPTSANLQSISPAYEQNIWAVGSLGTILRYSGPGGWNAVSPSPATELLYDVSTLPSGEAWAVGINGGIFHCNAAGSWSEVLPKPTTRPLRGVAAISSSDVWAVGEGGASPPGYTTVLHYNGISWSEYPSTAYGYMLDISAVSSNDIWASGSDGLSDALLFHYDGSGWTSFPVADSNMLWGIQARAAGDVWAVAGDGKVLHYNGLDWAVVEVAGVACNDVAAPGPGTVWVVGNSGLVLGGVPAIPAISSLSATSAYTGTAVTIAGTDFGADPGTHDENYVRFGAFAPAESDYLSWSDTQIVVRVPAAAYGGPVAVNVHTLLGGDSNASNLYIAPRITTVSPTYGNAGVTTVTLTGTGFGATQLANSSVWFGSSKATTYSSWSNTQIKVKVGAGAQGQTKVKVMASCCWSNAKAFDVRPVINSITPNTGTAGTQITISGSAFCNVQGAGLVCFGSTNVSTVVSWKQTQIKVNVPASVPVGAVTVKVYTLGGMSNGKTFTKM